MTRAALALGANLDEPLLALRGAVAGLMADPDVRVVTVSSLWRTAAVGGPEQPDYLNAVVLVDTTLPPRALLALAHALEDAAGRVREVRWGPRSLDVDVLAVGDGRSDDPELTIPHPRAHERSFVLAPWAEVDPGFVLTVASGPERTVADWAASITDQQVVLLDGGPWWR
jgi:2-amino-4-hydroxy-6-hydroxymethyldihydropteridine diphosphokinase